MSGDLIPNDSSDKDPLSESNTEIQVRGLLSNSIEEIKSLYREGAIEIKSTTDSRFAEEMKAVRTLSYSRGVIRGIIDSLTLLLPDSSLAPSLALTLDFLDNKSIIPGLKDPDSNMTSEVNALIGQMPDALVQIKKAITDIINIRFQGYDENTILAKDGDDYRWLEKASLLVYNQGYYQGVVEAIRLLSRKTPKLFALSETLIEEFYALRDNI